MSYDIFPSRYFDQSRHREHYLDLSSEHRDSLYVFHTVHTVEIHDCSVHTNLSPEGLKYYFHGL